MAKTLLGQFKDFVNKQPPDKPIKNNDGWRSCAVGEFVEYAGLDKDSVNENFGGYSELAQTICMGKFVGFNSVDTNELYDHLNISYFKTYGQLAEYLGAL